MFDQLKAATVHQKLREVLYSDLESPPLLTRLRLCCLFSHTAPSVGRQLAWCETLLITHRYRINKIHISRRRRRLDRRRYDEPQRKYVAVLPGRFEQRRRKVYALPGFAADSLAQSGLSLRCHVLDVTNVYSVQVRIKCLAVLSCLYQFL